MKINGFDYIPQEKRKKILLLSDDMRLHSGVANISRQFVIGTAHYYNWFQVGAALNHPDIGKRLDVSKDINEILNINDANVIIQPNNGYGDQDLIRALLHEQKFDAILHFTDPRQWLWLYRMEREIRQNIPIFFYHVWDNIPYPKYNRPYYLSCDWIGCISKQTYNIVKTVCEDDNLPEWRVTYIPHGIDKNEFYPINEQNVGKMREDENKKIKSDFELMTEFKNRLFKDKNIKYSILFNSRNIKRKNLLNIIYAFKIFCDKHPNMAKESMLLLRTDAVDMNGTDINKVLKDLAPNINVLVINSLDKIYLNYLYNIADVTISASSAEGFGLSTAESLMAGTPIIATVTGGLQDQMGFRDENGYIYFNKEWPTNSDGKIKSNYGEWVYPLFPVAKTLVGSPITPYIFDDIVNIEDIVEGIKYWAFMSKEERKNRGLKGREYLLQEEVGMENSQMCYKFIKDMETCFNNWKPREKYSIIKF